MASWVVGLACYSVVATSCLVVGWDSCFVVVLDLVVVAVQGRRRRQRQAVVGRAGPAAGQVAQAVVLAGQTGLAEN